MVLNRVLAHSSKLEYADTWLMKMEVGPEASDAATRASRHTSTEVAMSNRSRDIRRVRSVISQRVVESRGRSQGQGQILWHI